ncbi:hypothetical protein DUI87_14761 [Hirundo rustica rustica]|uniref:Uncharacterized protein n=1 Tax=Hirundo rustica rustica TaxID=333673 RepID=A0A3M0K5T2_HIRRU|nr:hypothetical protein DUI87_14761 [Hirundo rustica rustica]
MGLLRIMLPPKLQLLAVLVFGVAVLFLENQIQKLEESRGKLGTSLKIPSVDAHGGIPVAQICLALCWEYADNQDISVTAGCAHECQGLASY